MKNIFKCVALMVGLFALPFTSMAADQAAYEATAEKMIEAMNKLAGIMETVTDEATADAASASIKELTQKEMVPIAREMKALGDPDPEMEKALEEKFKGQMEASSNRMMTAMMAIAQKDPALMMKIQGAMEEFGRTMMEESGQAEALEEAEGADAAEAAE